MRRLAAVVGLVVGSVGIAQGVGVAPVAAVPAGFTDTVVAEPSGNPLEGMTGITPLPGGRAMVLEQSGAVRILANDGSIVPTDAVRLPVCSDGEMGLLGAAVDADFLLNGYVYLYATRSVGNCGSSTGRVNRVSRFTMTANTIDPASEFVLLDNIAATGSNHNGGDLEIGQDGHLYVAIGDAGSDPRPGGAPAAQDMSLLNGKIVRITTVGGVPPDNPFVTAPNAAPCATAGVSAPASRVCSEVYALGLRNPYRFAFDFDSGATRFMINDVGQGTWEEVNEGGAGRNYGWPAREGLCVTGSTSDCGPPPAGYTNPVTAYGRSEGCEFITAGAFIPSGMWPAAYDGAYLFGDGGCGDVWRLSNGAVDYGSPFAETSGGLSDMAFVINGADPSLYYVTAFNGELRRITYDAPAATASDALAYAPLDVADRVYDTRDGTGAAAGPMRGGTTRVVDLNVGSSVRAALVNLTMVEPRGAGFLVATENRTEHPPTSNINAAAGEFVANASIVPVDADGRIRVYTSVTTHAVIDVMGVFGPASSGGALFTPLSPQRLIDTREAASSTNTWSRDVIAPVSTVTAPVAGRLGVNADVDAVALIVTSVSAPGSAPGWVGAYPSGGDVPPTSNLNVNGAGDARPNLVIVPLGANGAIDLRLSNVADVVVDVAGSFAPASAGGSAYRVLPPSRQVDTRTPLGFATLSIGATGTINPGAPVPGSATAISQNVTLTNTFGGGYLIAHPGDEPRPFASNANTSGPNQTRASLTLTKVGANGEIDYFASGGADVVVDITGYFDGG